MAYDEQRWLPPQPPADPVPEPRKRGIGGGIAAALLALLAKGKALLLLLPKLKLLTTSGSMLVSIAAYSLIWGWRFAVGFVALLLVHETGHAVQMRIERIPVRGMVFVPLVGAAVWSDAREGNAAQEARIALAGPLAGGLGALACWGVGAHLDSNLWRALAFTGFLLNVLNLAPVWILDGARITPAMSPWMIIGGIGALVAVVLAWPNPMLVIVVLLIAYEAYRRRRDPARPWGRVEQTQRLAIGALYVGLLVTLALGADATHIVRTLADA